MTLDDLKTELGRRRALIVHCTRPGRDGERNALPIYPDDLRSAIHDIACNVNRPVSCSVVWPEHLSSFGPFGVAIRPTCLEGLGRLCPIDAGHGAAGSDGKEFSAEALEQLFAESRPGAHNEWILTSGHVDAIWVNLAENLVVSREVPSPPDGDGEAANPYLPATIRAEVDITLEEIGADFPELPIIAFRGDECVLLRAALK